MNRKRLHREKIQGVLKIILISVFGLIGTLFISIILLRFSGKKNLYKANSSTELNLEKHVSGNSIMDLIESAQSVSGDMDQWEEGDVRYNDKIYAYNNDILTFLFLGIDKREEVNAAEDFISGGQADVIFLAVLNPLTKAVSLIAIPRDTMTPIDIYDKEGRFLSREEAQIALQHGYGEGMDLSAQRTRDAVSQLFYGIPIHGYCTLNMGGIVALNDAIGGVTLTCIETFSREGYDYLEGDEMILLGKRAYFYLEHRERTVEGSAGLRLERQKQYIGEYLTKVKRELKKDISIIPSLYKELSKYMVTDIGVDEMSYLVSEMISYQFDTTQIIYTLEGETILNELDNHEELYLNQDYLKDLVIDIFYLEKSKGECYE